MNYKILLIPLLIFIIACSSSELPPEPTPLDGGNGITGNAVLKYTDLGWAPPIDVFDNNKQLVFVDPNPAYMGPKEEKEIEKNETESHDEENETQDNDSDINNETEDNDSDTNKENEEETQNYDSDKDSEEQDEEIKVTVEHQGGLVYKTGYIMLNDTFIPITLEGETIEGSNWLLQKGKTEIKINEENLNFGTNFVITYSCKKQEEIWKCGCTTKNQCGDWMLQDYIVQNTTIIKLDHEEETEKECNSEYIKEFDVNKNKKIEQDDKDAISEALLGRGEKLETIREDILKILWEKEKNDEEIEEFDFNEDSVNNATDINEFWSFLGSPKEEDEIYIKLMASVEKRIDLDEDSCDDKKEDSDKDKHD